MTAYIPTEREVQTLRAYLQAGSYAAAAELMDSSEAGVKQVLARFRTRAGVLNTTQLVYAYYMELAA